MVMKIPRQSYSFDSTVVVTLYIFMVSFVTQSLAFPTVHYCLHDQRDALLEFKHEFPVNESYSTTNYMSSWNKSSDCCSWEGVMCDVRSGNVISLRFVDVFLNNTLKLDSGLFKLQYLQYLIFAFCNLNGEIPSSFGNLSHLMVLDLTDNKFVGQVPASFGNLTQLRSLSLSGNKLSGNIPVSFCNLMELTTIFLDNNYFRNPFSGSFPMCLFMIPLLQVVNIERNQFSGPIEFVNSSSSRLYVLYAGHNKFDGSIPETISKLPNLARLDLSYNNFIGKIPISISQLVKLSDLDLSNNKLEGEVPSCLWKLTVLKLSQNSFSNLGKAPKVVDPKQMSVLRLDSNMFRGPFPHWICKFQSIDLLDLSNNSFSGSIPLCLRNITSGLHVLNLKNNNFSGNLPDVFVNATNLNTLDVSHNQLEGKLPKSLIFCKAMRLLIVQSNKFKDKFPFWLDSIQSLKVLILRSNQFYGPLYHQHVSIGFRNLKVIDASHNKFIGTFPASYFSNWQGMTTLNTKDDDAVYMEDPILYWDSYHNSMEMMQKGVDTHFEEIRNDFIAIDFSGNKFYGKIPNSIGLLKGLRVLNLSSNAFTRNVPKSLAMLSNLEALDLSRNKLTGQIPQDLGILSFLSKMNFSHNNLEGPIPQGTQFQSQKCSSFMENPRLNGLEEICGKAHVLNPPQKSEAFPKDEVINWIAAAIAYVPGVFCGLVIGHIFVSHKQEWLMRKFQRIKHKVVVRRAR